MVRIGSIVGILAIFVILYRIVAIMVPEMKAGVRNGDWGRVLGALTLLV